MTTGHPRRVKRPNFTFLAVQAAAILVGSLLLGIGVLGFVPGLTTDVSAMQWTASRSGASLFGVFRVSVLLNMFHILVGLCGLLVARSYARSRAYLLAAGALFLALWSYELFLAHHHQIADGWLHFGFGVAMIVLALTLAGARVPTGAAGEPLPTEID